MSVAALFVDPRGPYPHLVAEWWDEKRDARKYPGRRPVVAHPPCQLWTNFAALNYKRWGGEHNRPGNDGGCFSSALRSVRVWGGVLEHPAFSNAWAKFSLPRPGLGWSQHGAKEWVCEVWQSAYGHPARKRTWLFYCGTRAPSEGRWGRTPGTHQIGKFDRVKPTVSGRAASLTPIDFAVWLVSLAGNSQ
jgi:hypothetical protein